MKYHSFDVFDICEKCGVKRKGKPLTDNLMSFGIRKRFWVYFVNGVWQKGFPSCENKRCTDCGYETCKCKNFNEKLK